MNLKLYNMLRLFPKVKLYYFKNLQKLRFCHNLSRALVYSANYKTTIWGNNFYRYNVFMVSSLAAVVAVTWNHHMSNGKLSVKGLSYH